MEQHCWKFGEPRPDWRRIRIPERRCLDRDADRKVVARERGVSKITDDLYLKSKVSSFRHWSIGEGTISFRERANDAVDGDVLSRVAWLRRLEGMREKWSGRLPCDRCGHQ